MNVRFADTSYFLALVNVKDVDHAIATQYTHGRNIKVVTTTWVLVEFVDALSSVKNRSKAALFVRRFLAEPTVELVPTTEAQFRRGIERFEQRTDKDWSLTDCISFLAMEDRRITDALTADRHFEQAGFKALMRS